MKKYNILKFNQLGDERGHLVVAETMKEIPFEIRRVFYIYGSDDKVVRGLHANRESKFVLINLCGSCKIYVNDGKNEEIVVLDEPHKGIYLDNMVWKNMYEFSSDSILLVLSDRHYDANEYVRDFEGFLREVNGGGIR